MIDFLQFLFLPHNSNNQKAKILHLSSLTVLLFLIGFFQLSLTFLTRIRPGILGFAANINPDRLIQLTNQRRLEQGLPALAVNPSLIEAARQKASLMFAADCWSHYCGGHSPWWFFNNVGYNYSYAGENLAKDFADSESVVNAWMTSPSHRDNILQGNYKEIGIAVVDGLLNGEETTLIVQMFGSPVSTRRLGVAAEQTVAEPEKEVLLVLEEEEVLAGEEVLQEDKAIEQKVVKEKEEAEKPLVSSFKLTKTFYLILLTLLSLILAIDTFLVYQNRIVRISSKSFIHFSFFIIILISILLTKEGMIL